MLDEIEEFLTGLRRGAGTDRMLSTILFTDIVSSTEQAAEVGDRRWSEVLDRHDAVMRRQLTRFGGREVNTTGDGMVAAFDGPTRAVVCGQALVDAAAQVGISIRVGIHTGEVERRGDDVAGLAVHLAARVQALAEPGEVLVSRTVVDLVDRVGHLVRRPRRARAQGRAGLVAALRGRAVDVHALVGPEERRDRSAPTRRARR